MAMHLGVKYGTESLEHAIIFDKLMDDKVDLLRSELFIIQNVKVSKHNKFLAEIGNESILDNEEFMMIFENDV